MKRFRDTSTRSGWLMVDTLAGLFLLAALGMLLAVAANMRLRAINSFAAQRASLAVAQEVLSNLQSGRQPTTADPAAHVSIDRTGKRVGDLEWVEVTVMREGRRASLTGLARPAEAKAAIPPARSGGSS